MAVPIKFTYLTHHAAKNIWAYPKQDRQSITLPRKLSGFGGYRNRFNIQHRTFSLPERAKRFHVFQIGQLNPEFHDLFPIEDKWIRIDEIMNKSQMICDIYTGDGIMLPRCHCYYMWTDRRNLIIAVRESKTVPWEFNDEDVYFRVYSNAYFNILRRNLDKDFVSILSREITVSQDYIDLFNFKDEHINKQRGHMFIYINGVLRFDFAKNDAEVGDVVEMVYDSTIYKKVKINIPKLKTFDSIIDSKRKYLYSYSNNGDKWNNTIDYHDDIDFFIVRHRLDVEASWKGVYFHRNMGDSVRQLTHRDYSITVPYVRGFIDNDNQDASHDNKKVFDGADDVYIHAYIRRGMQDRNLVFNMHKLHELYKLDFTHRVGAMLGVRSNVEEWRADFLEKEHYTRLISSKEVVYDNSQVEKAYGYHAISYLTGYSPTTYDKFIIQGDSTKIALPHLLTKWSNHWEYDDKGILLGYRNHFYLCDYDVRFKETRLVESISGTATDKVGRCYNEDNIFLPDDQEWRVYRCEKGEELNLSSWKDVTDNKENLFAIEVKDGKKYLKWIADNTMHTTLFRTDKQVLAYTVLKSLDNGIIDFFLSEVVESDRGESRMKMLVPRGHIDVYCNGHALVRNIDYFIDFPRVVIVAKDYFENIEYGHKQVITIRHHGFCNSDLTMQYPEQTGYVQFDKLSKDYKYNLRDDKVLNFIVGGRVYDRGDLAFGEDNKLMGIKNRDPLEIEGKPWQIKDIIVPMRGMTQEDTYTMRAKSIETDTKISEYIEQFIPQSIDNKYPPIKKLYPLYSPFLSYILDDIRRGVFQFEKIYEHFNDQDILDACKSYEWLLKFDPVYQTKSIDFEYVIVHPHPHYKVLDVSIYEYRLLERIVKNYMKGRVNLSHFIRKEVYNP